MPRLEDVITGITDALQAINDQSTARATPVSSAEATLRYPALTDSTTQSIPTAVVARAEPEPRIQLPSLVAATAAPEPKPEPSGTALRYPSLDITTTPGTAVSIAISEQINSTNGQVNVTKAPVPEPETTKTAQQLPQVVKAEPEPKLRYPTLTEQPSTPTPNLTFTAPAVIGIDVRMVDPRTQSLLIDQSKTVKSAAEPNVPKNAIALPEREPRPAPLTVTRASPFAFVLPANYTHETTTMPTQPDVPAPALLAAAAACPRIACPPGTSAVCSSRVRMEIDTCMKINETT
jgi:hypothetical protein